MAELTVERLFSDPPLFGALPRDPQFTPDGDHVAYLRLADDNRERLDLWRVHLPSGRHELWVSGTRLQAERADGAPDATAQEKAERERRRQFASGITTFRFSADGRYLLLPVDGAGFVLDLDHGELVRVTPPDTRQTNMRFSPDSRYLTYVRDGNVYVRDLAAGSERPLTADGAGTVSNGLADFIAQEEMHRFDGYWWSDDGAWLAYTRVDESPIAESLRYEIDADQITVVPQRYPYAGGVNADVRLLVLHLESGQVHEMPYRQEDDDYLARVAWLGDRLVVQRQSRDQQTLELQAFHPASGDAESLLTETSDTWVNLHDNFLPLPEPGAAPGGRVNGFLWTSERDGSSHLYRHDGTRLAAVTGGRGRVNRVLWTDGDHALISGWFDTPTEQHLYRVSLADGTPPQRLTGEDGWHELVVQSDGNRAVDRLGSLTVPGRLNVLTLNGTGPSPASSLLMEEAVTENHAYFPYLPRHVTPELGTLPAEDGQTLHYRLTIPSGTPPPDGCPVIVYVYGGPGAQRVRNEWPPLLLQLLAQHGYGVLELDNRGSANRERSFESAIHLKLGSAEVRDQVLGARYVAGLPWVNAGRIGIFGHSYGGYMTLMCLMQAPEIFKAGVAVAPVTDWSLYDTHYTERYLGTPQGNPDGYRSSSVLEHFQGLAGRLLVVHGMADDNVLFTHSTRLFRALQSRNLPFEMMAYPGSKHALQERDVSIHRFSLLLDFFGRSL